MSELFHLRLAGALLVALGLAHAAFPRYFDWRRELASLSLLHRQIYQVHTLFIGITVIGMGLLCVTSGDALATTPLGRQIALGLAVFWLTRLLVQLFVYSPELWRGRRFETAMHVVFLGFWTYLTAVFAVVAR